MVLGLSLVSAIREKKISLQELPGIPILLVSVIFFKISYIFLNQILWEVELYFGIKYKIINVFFSYFLMDYFT